ncbi:MAG: PEP-CTERM sorting domain-containing protein [Pseudomonadota bacterium]
MIGNLTTYRNLLCLVLCCVWFSNAAAVFVDEMSSATNLNGNQVSSTQFPGLSSRNPGGLDIQLDVFQSGITVLDLVIEQSDTYGYIGFSIGLVNHMDFPFNTFFLAISDGATFYNTNNLSAAGVIELSPMEDVAIVNLDAALSPGEQISLGSADGASNRDDWVILFDNLGAGDRFQLSIGTVAQTAFAATSVPEPSAILLILLAASFFLRHRVNVVRVLVRGHGKQIRLSSRPKS